MKVQQRMEKLGGKTGRVPFWRSIQTKFAMAYLLVVAAIVLVLNTYPLLMAQNMVFRSKESSLKSQALAVAAFLILP